MEILQHPPLVPLYGVSHCRVHSVQEIHMEEAPIDTVQWLQLSSTRRWATRNSRRNTVLIGPLRQPRTVALPLNTPPPTLFHRGPRQPRRHRPHGPPIPQLVHVLGGGEPEPGHGQRAARPPAPQPRKPPFHCR